MDRFSTAAPDERIEAVLAAVREPCTQDLVCKYAGVDLTDIDEDTSQRIAEIFRRSEVTREPRDEVAHYWVPPEQQPIVLERIAIEIETVRRHIASFGLKKYGRN